MSQLFLNKIKKARDPSLAGQTLAQVNALLDEQRAQMKAVGQFIGMESLTDSQESELSQAVTSWSEDLRRITQELSMEKIQTSQLDAATAIMVV